MKDASIRDSTHVDATSTEEQNGESDNLPGHDDGRVEKTDGRVEKTDAKRKLRKVVLARRDSIPPSERAERSVSAGNELEALLRPEMTIAVYAAFGSEVALDSFIRAAYDAGARVCFPCMTRDARVRKLGSAVMRFWEVSHARYEKGHVPFLDCPLRSWDADDPELNGYASVDAAAFDLVIVPLVAFDQALNRLGYGGGNYDRLLPRLRPDAQIIGIAFAEQEVTAVPVEAHDCPLPRVIVA